MAKRDNGGIGRRVAQLRYQLIAADCASAADLVLAESLADRICIAGLFPTRRGGGVDCLPADTIILPRKRIVTEKNFYLKGVDLLGEFQRGDKLQRKSRLG